MKRILNILAQTLICSVLIGLPQSVLACDNCSDCNQSESKESQDLSTNPVVTEEEKALDSIAGLSPSTEVLEAIDELE